MVEAIRLVERPGIEPGSRPGSGDTGPQTTVVLSSRIYWINSQIQQVVDPFSVLPHDVLQ